MSGNLFTGVELDRPDAPAVTVLGITHEGLSNGLKPELQALGFERFLQHARSGAVKLPFHQPRHDVDDGDVHATQIETVRRLKPQQSAADDDGVLVLASGSNHAFRVYDIAIGEHAVNIFPC